MATINFRIDGENVAQRELLELRRQLNDLTRELAENREAYLTANDAERENLRTRQAEIRVLQGLNRARQADNRLQQQQTRLVQQAERARQQANRRTFTAIQQFNRRFIRDAERTAREYVRDWERAERDRERATRDAQRELERTLSRSRSQLRSMLRPIREIGRAFLLAFSFGGAFAVERIGRFIFNATLQIDNLERSLTALLGSASRATAEIENLRSVAQLPGITFEAAARQFQSLVAIDVPAERALRTIREFGNAASLSAVGTQELNRALTGLRQTFQRGALDQENLNQITENLPLVARALREEFGSALAEDIRQVEPNLDRLFTRLLSRLETLPRAAQESTRNAFDNLRNALFQLAAEVGDQFLPLITRGVEGITLLVNEQGPAIVRQVGAVADAIERMNITFRDLRNLVTLLTTAGGFFALFRLFRTASLAAAATGGRVSRLTQFFTNLIAAFRSGTGAGSRFGRTMAFLGRSFVGFERVARSSNVLVKALGVSLTALSRISLIVSAALGVKFLFDLFNITNRAQDAASSAQRLADELSKLETPTLEAAEAFNQGSEAINRLEGNLRALAQRAPILAREIAQSLRGANVVENLQIQESATSLFSFLNQLNTVNQEITELVGDADPQQELERLQNFINAQAEAGAIRGGGIPFGFGDPNLDAAQRFERLRDLLANQLRLQRVIESIQSNIADEARVEADGRRDVVQAAVDAANAKERELELQRNLNVAFEAYVDANNELIRREGVLTQERERTLRERIRLQGPLLDPRPVGEISDARTGDVTERALVAIQENTGNQFEALRLLQRALENVVRLPVTSTEREAAVRRELGDDAADVRFPSRIVVPRVSDPEAEQEALESTINNTFIRLRIVGQEFFEAMFRGTARVRANTLPAIFNLTRGLRGLGPLFDDANEQSRRNAQERNRQLEEEFERIQALQRQRAESIVGIGVTALTDLARTPGRVRDISASGAERLRQVEIDRQRDLERINNDAALSAERRAERIEEIERTSAQRRIDIERQVNREKQQAYTGFINNALRGTAELIRQELQAAAIRATANQVSSFIGNALGPGLLALGSGGSIGIGLAAVAGLQLLGSFINNPTFHFADADLEARLAGRESATAALNRRQNAEDFSQNFAQGFQQVQGQQATQQGQPVIQVNAVDVESDDALARNYIRISDLIDAGVVVRRA